MKFTKSFLFMVAFAAGLLTTINSCTKESITFTDEATTEVVTDRNAGPKASGQGSLSSGENWRIFAFNAVTQPNGTVTGQGQLTRTPGGVKIHFSIDCLTVTGNEARMSGTITQFDENPNAVGSECWFKVRDNGEGANAPKDAITLFVYCPNAGVPCGIASCDVYDPAIALIPIEAGNIQVQE